MKKRNVLITRNLVFLVGTMALLIGGLTAATASSEDTKAGERCSYDWQCLDDEVCIEGYCTAINVGLVPVGSIVAWHKSLVSFSASLPDGWVECNGQVIEDEGSRLFGKVVPDLNGGGQFLRGGLQSGTLEEGSSVVGYPVDTGGCTSVVVENGDTVTTSRGGVLTNNTTANDGCGNFGHAFEIRPRNMSVVWIMRIK